MNNHEQALLRRAQKALLAWAKKYGEHNPPWLPPAGDVQLAEDIDAALQPTEQPEAYIEGGRESVEDALEIVESFGSDIRGINDTFARQIILATEVKRLRALYESAVGGRSAFRNAFRKARESIIPPLGCPACGLTHDKNDCPSANSESPVQPEAAQDERDRFEAWAESKYPMAVQQHSLGAYARGLKKCAWDGWQARASLAQKQVAVTDSDIREVWMENVSTDPELHDWHEMLKFARALLSLSAQSSEQKG